MYSVGRWTIIFCFFLLNNANSLSEINMSKCCPPGKVFSGTGKVDCVAAPYRTAELQESSSRTRVVGDVQFVDGFPGCEKHEDLETVPLGKLLVLPKVSRDLYSPACIEILHDRISHESLSIVVHCKSNDERFPNKLTNTSRVKLPRVITVRKCCKKNEIYEENIRSCVTDNDNDGTTDKAMFEILSQKMNDLVDFFIVEKGPPKCEQVIFDRVINASDLRIMNGTLHVTIPSNDRQEEEQLLVTTDNACLELLPEDSYLDEKRLMLRVCQSMEHCLERSCVRKCCPEDEMFLTNRCVKFSEPISTLGFHQALGNFSNRSDTMLDYGLLVGKPCKYSMYPVTPEEGWSLTSKGYVDVPEYGIYQHRQYCMDILHNHSTYEVDLYPFICFDTPSIVPSEEISPIRFGINAALELTSCTFLLMTLLVYACLPTLQNLHGKTLMCHVSSLLLAYACLAIISLSMPGSYLWDNGNSHSDLLCKILGYTMLFSFLSAFSWLNVMCFDIWWTFGGLRGSISTRARLHRKRFISYCCYAWGIAFLISTVGFVVDSGTEIFPVSLRPHMAVQRCWFLEGQDFYGEIVFFIGPVTIQLMSNVVFFVLTSIHCSRVKAGIRRVITNLSDSRSKRFHSDRTKFIMNIKLFVVMGISWVMEFVSFFINHYTPNFKWRAELFYISDVVNCLQGLLIFILFVLKTRVYLALRRRLGLKNKRRAASNATMALQDPHRVKKSASSSTLMSTFAVSMAS